jgi:hypothetical protein
VFLCVLVFFLAQFRRSSFERKKDKWAASGPFMILPDGKTVWLSWD